MLARIVNTVRYIFFSALHLVLHIMLHFSPRCTESSTVLCVRIMLHNDLLYCVVQYRCSLLRSSVGYTIFLKLTLRHVFLEWQNCLKLSQKRHIIILGHYPIFFSLFSKNSFKCQPILKMVFLRCVVFSLAIRKSRILRWFPEFIYLNIKYCKKTKTWPHLLSLKTFFLC